MKKGDVVTVVTFTGEYVGELAKTEPLTLKIFNEIILNFQVIFKGTFHSD